MKKRILFIVLILLVLVGIGGFYFYQQRQAAVRVAALARQTTTVTRGTLVATVTGAGNLYAPQQTNLSFEQTGVPITKINVNVGDQIKTGAVLAQADDSDLQFAVRSAQAQLASAQASLAKLQQPPLDADVQAAKAAISSAQSAYNVAVNKAAHGPDTIAQQKAALDNATASLQQAQAAYDRIAWRSDAGTSSEALALQQGTNNYQAALAAYNLALTDVNDSAVKAAAQQLASAQDSLVKLTQPPTAQDLAVAQAAVDSAQTQLDQAQRNLDHVKIIAPFDGTVAGVNYVEGQLSPSGSAAVITLVNMNNLQTQITISEVDIPRVQMDQQVNLTFDALGNQTFPGKITSISPVGLITQGVVNYTVTVALTKPDKSILPGMTSEANIVVAQRQNVLMVPNRAIQTRGNQHLLTMLFEGNEIPLVVQTGLINDTSTEIVSATGTDGQAVDLQDGYIVVLNPTTTTGGNTRGGQGLNPLGGFGGFGGGGR